MTLESIHSLSNDELNRKCAELAGYRLITHDGVGEYEHFYRYERDEVEAMFSPLYVDPDQAIREGEPDFAGDASASMVLLDEMQAWTEGRDDYFEFSFGDGGADLFLMQHRCDFIKTIWHIGVTGKPSVALPRAIAEAYLYYRSNMQENKV